MVTNKYIIKGKDIRNDPKWGYNIDKISFIKNKYVKLYSSKENKVRIDGVLFYKTFVDGIKKRDFNSIKWLSWCYNRLVKDYNKGYIHNCRCIRLLFLNKDFSNLNKYRLRWIYRILEFCNKDDIKFNSNQCIEYLDKEDIKYWDKFNRGIDVYLNKQLK